MMRVHEMKKLIIPFLVTLLMPFGISYCWGQAQVAADSSSSQYSGVVERGKDARLDGDYHSAVKFLAPVVKAEPDNYTAEFNLGLAYVGLGKTADGVDTLKKAKQLAIEQKISDKQVFNSYGWALLVDGDFRKADSAFVDAESQWAQLDPQTKKKLLNNHGLALMYMGKYSDAEVYFNRAINEFDNSQAKINLKRVQELQAVGR